MQTLQGKPFSNRKVLRNTFGRKVRQGCVSVSSFDWLEVQLQLRWQQLVPTVTTLGLYSLLELGLVQGLLMLQLAPLGHLCLAPAFIYQLVGVRLVQAHHLSAGYPQSRQITSLMQNLMHSHRFYEGFLAIFMLLTVKAQVSARLADHLLHLHHALAPH